MAADAQSCAHMLQRLMCLRHVGGMLAMAS
jgi:hypothetical protein